MSGFVPRRQNR